MTVDKLSRLFSALGGSSQGYSSTNSSRAKTEEVTAPRVTEAVSIAPSFGQSKEVSTEASRKARVEEIKAQVKEGSYRPDSTKVAEALARDLFA